MNTSAIRGAVLVALAVLVGALVLFQGLNDSPTTPETARIVSPTSEPTVVADATPTAVVDNGEVATATAPPLAQPAPATSLKHDPSEVSVQVANASAVEGPGTGVAGLAGNLTRVLQQRNYVMRTATNATINVPTSTVYYEEGYDGDAREIVDSVFGLPNIAILPMPVPPPEVDNPEPGGVNILIIAGADELARS